MTTKSNVERRKPRSAGYRLQPIRAFTAMRRLIRDKEDTGQVFEIMRALAGGSIPRGYRRLLRTPAGGRAAYAHNEFARQLSDKAWLAQFAPGTVGAAYRDFIAPRGLTAEGLAEESRKLKDVDIDAAHPYAWYSRRLRDVHDIWHVLTGYGTDGLGEACVVAFSFAQTGSLGFGFIGLMAALEYERLGLRHPYLRAAWQAYRTGRKAEWLPAEDYEALFAEPLSAARQRLNIRPASVYLSIPVAARDKPFRGSVQSVVGESRLA